MANRERSIVLRIAARSDGSVKRVMGEASTALTRAATDGKKASKTLAQSVRDNERAYTDAGAALAGFGAVTVLALGGSAKAAIDWQSAFAGVRKTVDGSAAEFAGLADGIRGLSRELPTSANEIAGVAEAAGQLGIQTPNILEFSETMVNLGETTNLSAGEAATAIARFANVMGTSQSEFDNIGSAIVGLGNNFATTEAEIVAMASRLSGAGRQAGLTEGEVLGLSTALSSVGIEAEAGGTAFSRVLIDMGKAVDSGSDSLGVFAEASGLTSEQFAAQWATDSGGAVSAFIEGLGSMQSSGESIQPVLEDLGLTDIRVGDALRRSASASDLFSDAMAQGNKDYEENVALTKEAELRYETTAAKIGIAKNAFVDMGVSIGETFLPAIDTAADGMAMLAGAAADLPDPVQKTVAGIGGVVGVAALAAGGLLLLAPRIVATKDAFTTLGVSAAGARGGLRKFAGFLGGPYGIALTVATIGLTTWINKQSEAKEATEALQATLDEQTGAFSENTSAYVLDTLEKEKSLQIAQDLGVSSGLITAAIQDEGDARARLRGILEADTEVRGTGNSAMVLQSANSQQLEGDLNGLYDAYDVGTEAQKRQIEETKRLAAATPEAEAAFRLMNIGLSETGEVLAEINPLMEENAAESEAAAEAAQKWRDELAGIDSSFVDFGTALSDTTQASQDWAQGQADAYNTAAGEHTEMVRKRVAEQVESGEHSQEWADAQIEASEKGTKTWEDYYDGQTVNLDNYLDNLAEQVEAQAEWETNMVILSGKVSQGVLDELARMGPEGAPLVAELVDGSKDQLQVMEDAFGQKGGDAVAAVVSSLDGGGPLMAAAASQLGEKASRKLAEKLASGEITAQEAIDKYDLIVDVDSDLTPLEERNFRKFKQLSEHTVFTLFDLKTEKQEATFARAKEIITGTTATSKFDLNPGPAETVLYNQFRNIKRSTGTSKFDLNPKPAESILYSQMRTIGRTTGTSKLDLDNDPATGVLDRFDTKVTGTTSTMKMDMDTTDARDDFRTFVKDSDGRTIGIKFSNGSQLLAGGGDVQGQFINSTADNVLARLTPKEFVTRVDSAERMRRENPGALEHINRTGTLPQFASGGSVSGNPDFNGTFDVDWLEGVLGGVGKRGIAAAQKSYMDAGGGPKATGGLNALRPLAAQFGVPITSGYRPGARTATGYLSKHGQGKAMDTGLSKRFWDYLEAQKGRWSELYGPWGLWNKGLPRSRFPGADTVRRIHQDHIHVATYGDGGTVQGDLHPGEHVLSKSDVSAMGGHDSIYAQRRAALGGRDNSFAIGGAVGQTYGQRYAAMSGAAPSVNVAAPSLEGLRISGSLRMLGDGMAEIADGRIVADKDHRAYNNRMVGQRG